MSVTTVAVKRYVRVGDRVPLVMPYSEVCMHLRVAGTVMLGELLPSRMVQLFTVDGVRVSFPVTSGEAGLYEDDHGMFYSAHRCATVGCSVLAAGTLSYPGGDGTVHERVCGECGEEYARRPALGARFTPDQRG